MIENIKKYQEESKSLEAQSKDLSKILNVLNDHTVGFVNELASNKSYFSSEVNPKDFEITASENSFEQLLSLYTNQIANNGISTASGRYLGYIPGGGLPLSAVGDFLAAISNKFSGLHFAAPGAVTLENELIKWIVSLVGFPSTAGGFLSSGGSLANLSAIVAARDHMKVRSSDFEKLAIYYTDHTHYCIEKALSIVGLKDAIKRKIPVDAFYKMDIDSLEKQINLDRQNGAKPFMIVATAGTTNTGTVDPIEQIAEIAEKYKIWFHVDAAYGGFFLLTQKGKELFKGIEKADSVVMDPHKSLFLPYGTGILLVRNAEILAKSNVFEAGYLQDAKSEDNLFSPSNISPELTRHFRGLRMWFPLKMYGVKAFEAALEEKLLLGKHFYTRMSAIKGVELKFEPELSIVLFRLKPPKGNVEEFNNILLRRLQKEGNVYLSATVIDEQTWLRVAVLSFRTHLEEIETAIKSILTNAKDLLKELN